LQSINNKLQQHCGYMQTSCQEEMITEKNLTIDCITLKFR